MEVVVNMPKREPVVGWTAKGDEYNIIGGDWEKKDHINVRLIRKADRIMELWQLPKKEEWEKDISKLERKLEGPFGGESGLFGRRFLEVYGELIRESRLPIT